MPERILIGVAWPYANGSLHMGHIAGCYLAADIFARYHRLKSDHVLMVSGSDQHGTPITLRAEQDGVSPQEVVSRYHKEFLESWERLGITFDLFTNTGTDNHREVVQDIFRGASGEGLHLHRHYSAALLPNLSPVPPGPLREGHLPPLRQHGRTGRPVRPVRQAAEPGRPHRHPVPHLRRHPEIRDSEHFFLKLSAFQDSLLAWVREQRHWRPSVLNFTQRYLEDGLKDRAISRDLEWGVPLPVDGYDGKRIYVWFEAVIGYLSASKEWAKLRGEPEAWEPYWHGDAKGYYFIGKDNIPFHTIIWPAMLAGYGGLDLPYDVPANEFLNLEGRQLSTSRNWAVWVPDYLDRYDPDPLRYYMSATMPETSDSDFSWRDFVRRNNDELVATYGNLVHRVLTFTYRNFEGRIPQPGDLDDGSREVLAKAEQAFQAVDDNLYKCHFGLLSARPCPSRRKQTGTWITRSPGKTVKQDTVTTATTFG